jgi:hypothetical protein
MLLLLLLALSPESQIARHATALLRFVARAHEPEPHELLERRAAADELVALKIEGAIRLREAVASGRDRETARLAGTMLHSIESASGWTSLPERRPDLARGGRLYAQSCAACHGDVVRPPAAQLETPAPSFLDPLAADALSPRRVFDAITAGIPESPMPSFDDALTVADRWSIAFYVQAMRHARPGRASKQPGLSLEAAAVASDALLRARFEAAGLTPSAIEPALAAVRWHPPHARGTARLALIIPGWLAPVALRLDRFDRVDLVLQGPAERSRLFLLVTLIARQAFLRAAVPLTDLSVSILDAAGEPVARCGLVNLARYQCGVAPR